LLAIAVAGCGGKTASGGTGGSAAGTGGGAAGTGGGHPGTGGVGALDGGAGQGGGAGQTGGLPPCAIQTRPANPADGTDANFADPRTHLCNTIEPAGAWITPEVYPWGDAGVPADAGAGARPQGGVVLDGDYDLIRLQVPGSGGHRTRRTIRVFDGGTFIERGVLTENPSADGGVTGYWYNTTEAPSGTDFNSQEACGAVQSVDAYTVDGDLLTLFVYLHTTSEPSPFGIDSYRRTCTR
jgi:hypothetical protein